MSERVRHAAIVSVSRGCGFAALAIFCVMFALSSSAVAALNAGGILSLIVCLALLYKANRALNRPYRETEVWTILERRDRPAEAVAQRIIGKTLRETFLQFASYSSAMAGALLAGALFVSVLGHWGAPPG